MVDKSVLRTKVRQTGGIARRSALADETLPAVISQVLGKASESVHVIRDTFFVSTRVVFIQVLVYIENETVGAAIRIRNRHHLIRRATRYQCRGTVKVRSR